MNANSLQGDNRRGEDKWGGGGMGGLTQNNRWNSFDNLLNSQNEPDPDIYIAKHDYTTDQPGQLSIRKGEKLKISRKSENGDWCEGTNIQGEIGWVPASYIAKVSVLPKRVCVGGGRNI